MTGILLLLGEVAMREKKSMLLLFSLSLLVGVKSESTNSLKLVSLEDYNQAVCNDGSEAVYYISPSSSGSSSHFIIFLEGGGGCSSFRECNQEWLRTQGNVKIPQSLNPYMSSAGYRYSANTVLEGRDLLSSNATENPMYHNYTRVLLPYCTQDAFLAHRPNPKGMRNGALKVEDNDDDNFSYNGRVIYQSLIRDLVMKRDLNNASRVVLAGSSSGGIGILNNLAWTNEFLANETDLGMPPELMAIIDSSWFVPFEGNHVLDWNETTARAFNLPEACSDVSLGYSCCTSPACLFSRGYLSDLDIPIFIITSTQDIFNLGDVLVADIQATQAESNSQSIDDYRTLRLFNRYGSIVNKTLTQTTHLYERLTIFEPSCTQHVFFATSSLWDDDGLLSLSSNEKVERLQEGFFTLTNPITSGTWTSAGLTLETGVLYLRQALYEWNMVPHFQNHHTDNCTGPACGKFCPSRIEINAAYAIWPSYINIIILCLSAFMTAIPVFIKLGLYFHMKYILFCQKVYAFNMKHSPKSFPKATVPVNVSCVDLTYRIDTVNRGNKEDKANSAQNTNQYRDDQYSVYAGIETFAPCLKNVCSSYICQYKAPVEDKVQQVQATMQPLRTDSGISSSINHQMRRSLTPQSVDTMSMYSMDSRDSLVDLREPEPSCGRANSGRSGIIRLQRSKSSMRRERKNIRKKTILHHVNMYVNPGELLAIMGPSGSGKTTLLDVLLGRRSAGYTEGEILINGMPLHKIREWFIVNTGYVRQLAKSYYNELTVRENLIFSMCLQAPSGMKLSQKLERVEQVIRETGLQEQADIVVGDGIGLGLSGGQRKRLAIAVQLLSMPNIIFLDEPTSGLDSASSLDILKSLQVMAGTGRAIVVAIHQPRSEIFHAFDKILLLCKGQIAFYGSPVKVWEFFRKALISEKELDEAEGQVQDAVLDLLKEKSSQKQVLQAYRDSNEPQHVQQAVQDSRQDQVDFNTTQQLQGRNPGIWHRLMVLESRSSLRQTIFTIIYLPIVYTVFGLILGTTYLQTNDPIQIMSVTCILSCSSSLFMSSIINSLLLEPLKLFYLEHSDGISRSHELILQVFFRMSAVCTLPLAICCSIIFILVYQVFEFQVYVIVLLAFLLVNQVWVSIFIVLNVLAPTQAHRLCPIFAATGGFCCGFVVPKSAMPDYYRWIFYINPSFYAYATTSVTVLERKEVQCDRDSMLECFRVSGLAALQRFDLVDQNPIENMVVLIAMVLLLIFLGIFILQIRVNFGLIKEKLFNLCCVASARRKRQQRVMSSDVLNETVNNPGVMLSSFVKKKGGNKSAAETSPDHFYKGGHASPDGGFISPEDSKKNLLRKLSRTQPSLNFLDTGYHFVLHDFPWARDELLRDVEETDAGDAVFSTTGLQPHSTAQQSSLFSPTSRHSRIASDGSEDVFEPENIIPDIALNMEEEQNEEQRRLQANLKWNLRRQKIEQEINRLRHYSINRSRAAAAGGPARLRHSVSFGDDLEIQLESSQLRALEEEDEEEENSSEDNEIRNRNSFLNRSKRDPHKKSLTLGAKCSGMPFQRAASMPGEDMEGKQRFPVMKSDLSAYAEGEDEEDENDEEGGIEIVGRLGLPPKDVPINSSLDQIQQWAGSDEVD